MRAAGRPTELVWYPLECGPIHASVPGGAPEPPWPHWNSCLGEKSHGTFGLGADKSVRKRRVASPQGPSPKGRPLNQELKR